MGEDDCLEVQALDDAVGEVQPLIFQLRIGLAIGGHVAWQLRGR